MQPIQNISNMDYQTCALEAKNATDLVAKLYLAIITIYKAIINGPESVKEYEAKRQTTFNDMIKLIEDNYQYMGRISPLTKIIQELLSIITNTGDTLHLMMVTLEYFNIYSKCEKIGNLNTLVNNLQKLYLKLHEKMPFDETDIENITSLLAEMNNKYISSFKAITDDSYGAQDKSTSSIHLKEYTEIYQIKFFANQLQKHINSMQKKIELLTYLYAIFNLLFPPNSDLNKFLTELYNFKNKCAIDAIDAIKSLAKHMESSYYYEILKFYRPNAQFLKQVFLHFGTDFFELFPKPDKPSVQTKFSQPICHEVFMQEQLIKALTRNAIDKNIKPDDTLEYFIQTVKVLIDKYRKTSDYKNIYYTCIAALKLLHDNFINIFNLSNEKISFLKSMLKNDLSTIPEDTSLQNEPPPTIVVTFS